GEVAGDRVGLAAGRADLGHDRVETLRPPGHDDDLRARGRERSRNRGPDALAAAGDEGGPAGEVSALRQGVHVGSCLPVFRTVTAPVVPSMRSVSPVRIRRVPSRVFTMHGMPSSRATIAPWLSWPPMSMTTAPAARNSETQLGSVVAQTRISPGSRSSACG